MERTSWTEARRLALQRDGDCTAATWDDLPCRGGLDVHHISGDKTDHSLENLTVLCDSHHARLHHLQRSNELRLTTEPVKV